jgi:PAS domain S-box-containing protein
MLNNSEKKFRSISELAHDAIIMMDVSGAVTYWNKAAEKIFGYADDEMIGRELHAALAPRRYCESYMKGLDHFKTTGTGNAIGKSWNFRPSEKTESSFHRTVTLSRISGGQTCSQ